MKKKQKKKQTKITISSYYLLNPAHDITIALRMLGDKAEGKAIIKGKPEDFTDHPNEVFRLIDKPITLNTKGLPQ